MFAISNDHIHHGELVLMHNISVLYTSPPHHFSPLQLGVPCPLLWVTAHRIHFPMCTLKRPAVHEHGWPCALTLPQGALLATPHPRSTRCHILFLLTREDPDVMQCIYFQSKLGVKMCDNHWSELAPVCLRREDRSSQSRKPHSNEPPARPSILGLGGAPDSRWGFFLWLLQQMTVKV